MTATIFIAVSPRPASLNASAALLHFDLGRVEELLYRGLDLVQAYAVERCLQVEYDARRCDEEVAADQDALHHRVRRSPELHERVNRAAGAGMRAHQHPIIGRRVIDLSEEFLGTDLLVVVLPRQHFFALGDRAIIRIDPEHVLESLQQSNLDEFQVGRVGTQQFLQRNDSLRRGIQLTFGQLALGYA
jgi:hypothetical protein